MLTREQINFDDCAQHSATAHLSHIGKALKFNGGTEERKEEQAGAVKRKSNRDREK